MKAVVESTYYIRDKAVTSYHSFPEYSDRIESTMSSLLEFLKGQDSDFTLELRLIHAR